MNQELAIEMIKSLAKDRLATQKDLAQALGLSVAAIKRIFSKKQITFDNIIGICHFFKIEVSEFFNLIEQQNKKEFIFSDEQENFLGENPCYLSYLYEIRCGKTPSQIRSQFKITEKSSQKYLKKLKELGLVKFDGEKHVAVMSATVSWRDDGPIGKFYSTKTLRVLFDRCTNPRLQGGKFYLDLKGLLLSSRQLDDFIDEIDLVLKKYMALSNQPTKGKKDKLIPLSSAVIIDNKPTDIFNEIYDI
jgi:transcriptional regulator with XRE-family HTH domain